ncbi:Protein of unknown function [Gryllus bimaculatus]|nr:Protein of unknown function [Gryllus bimaculatus]
MKVHRYEIHRCNLKPSTPTGVFICTEGTSHRRKALLRQIAAGAAWGLASRLRVDPRGSQPS